MEFESLPAITVPEVRKVLTRMKGKAGGPDGRTTDLIDQLPDVFIQRLCQFLQACENAGSWPLGLRDWAVRFIPKKKTGSIPELGSLRPISIGPVYRVWSAVRLRHLTPRLKGLFDRHQILDVYDCLISLHQEYPENDYPFGLCLDFSKCFDSCDAALCVLSSFGITVSGVYVTCCSMGQSFAVGLLWGCRLVSSHLCSVRPAARRPLVTVHADAVLASAAALSASYRA